MPNKQGARAAASRRHVDGMANPLKACMMSHERACADAVAALRGGAGAAEVRHS
jgi:hypothetical protein